MNHLEYFSTPPLPFLIAGSLSFRSRFRPAADARAASFPPHYTGNICISVYRLNIHEGVPVSGRFARQIQGESYELPFALLLFSHSTPSSLASFFLFPPSILVSPASAPLRTTGSPVFRIRRGLTSRTAKGDGRETRVPSCLLWIPSPFPASLARFEIASSVTVPVFGETWYTW